MKKAFRILGFICFPIMFFGGFATAIGLQGQPQNIWIAYWCLVASLLVFFVSWFTFILLDWTWFESVENLKNQARIHYKLSDRYAAAIDKFSKTYLRNFGADLIELEKERLEWSLKTFPEATPISSLSKLKSEIIEIEWDINKGNRNPEEYADALKCLLDSAGRQGIFLPEIIQSFESKLKINKGRVWQKNADNSYSHIKQNHEERI